MSEAKTEVFYLPSERSMNNVADQGWQIETVVKESKIPCAGNGRFANMDVPKGSRVLLKPMISMDDITSVLSIPKDRVINFKNVDEIETFIQLYEKEGNQSREDIVDCLAHFIWSLPSIEGVTLCFSTWSMNHGDPGSGENIRFTVEDGTIIGKTSVDIKKGDELLNDYRDFSTMSAFWLQFCQKEGVKDVLTHLKEAVSIETICTA